MSKSLINWEKAPKGATGFSQTNHFLAFTKDGYWWDVSVNAWTKMGVKWMVIEKRPKQPLTEEQIKGVKEFGKHLSDMGVLGVENFMDMWIQERNNND